MSRVDDGSAKRGTTREAVRGIIEEVRTPSGKLFNYTIQGLIVLSLVSFSIETVPDLPRWATDWLRVIEVFTVVIFTAEYMLRVWTAERPTAYVFSLFGLVDLLAILPFYVTRSIDLRSIRGIRLLRLFRLFKLGRYSAALVRLRDAFLEIREELTVYLGLTALLIYLSAVGIYYFESDAQPEHFRSVFHCLWWAVVTLTTVGYGDVYPVTLGGRIFTFFVVFLGIGVVAVPSGLMASALTKIGKESRHTAEDQEMRSEGRQSREV